MTEDLGARECSAVATRTPVALAELYDAYAVPLKAADTVGR